MKYRVERLFTYGWDDADWAEDDEYGNRVSLLFDTKAEAQAEIDELCAASGDDPKDFRIVVAS